MDETLYRLIAGFALATLIEALLYLTPMFWRQARLPLSALALALNGFVGGGLLFYRLNPLLILAAILSAYRIFNLLRVARERLQLDRLRQIAGRTYLMLTLTQISLLFLWSLLPALDIKSGGAVMGLAAAQLALGAGLLYATIKNLLTSQPPKDAAALGGDLPALTVAIPARNETVDLTAVLETLLKSDYPKLEIVVYDDCSQDVTAGVVRDFSHRGVRFINAKTLRANWLAKNQAYDRLTEEASGELILFCGVDARFEPTSLSRLVATLKAHRLTMLSVLPQRANKRFSGFLIQSIRYWWEIALPRWLFSRPPVLSTCWLIEKAAIKKLGGFRAIARLIRPENYFARELNKTGAYSFYRTAGWLGITSVKTIAGQVDTALRTRYPQLKQRPETVAAVSLIEAGLLLGPLVLLIGGLLSSNSSLTVLSGLALLTLMSAQSLIIYAARHSVWWYGPLTFPVIVALDIWLAHYSMWKYEFSDVIWKGRNICLPVLRAIPNLPLDEPAPKAT